MPSEVKRQLDAPSEFSCRRGIPQGFHAAPRPVEAKVGIPSAELRCACPECCFLSLCLRFLLKSNVTDYFTACQKTVK